jgi:DNA-binding transcriptional ArsR family regulator
LNKPRGDRRFKEQVYELVARIARAADSPRRLEILEVLAQGPRSVESLAGETALSVANASRHLQLLRQAGLVEGRKRGLFVEYRLADAEVFDLLRVLRVIAERRLGDVERLARGYLGTRDELEPVGREELLERVRSRIAVVLDVRPREEYRAGHIAGAVSIPVAELAEAPSRAAGAEGDRRLLPGSPLCHGVRRRRDAPSARAAGAPAGGGLPRVAGRGAAGPGRRGGHAVKLLFILSAPRAGGGRLTQPQLSRLGRITP